MTKRLLLVLVAIAACGASRDVQAASIAIEVGVAPVSVGQRAFVFLQISGVGDPGLPNLGAFDVELSYDADILRPNRVTFFGELGDPDIRTFVYDSGSYAPFAFGAGEAVTSASASDGGTRLMEVSLLSDSPDLAALQSSPFYMVGLIFDAIAVGTSPLGLQVHGLADGGGSALPASLSGDTSIRVSSIPEPSAMLLVLGGVAWVLTRARRGMPPRS